MAKNTLQKELEKQDPEELLRLLSEISRRFPVAKMYLTMEFGLEGTAIIEKYKKEITNEYFPTRGTGKARSSRITKILKEFALISAFKEDLVEMYWFQVKSAIGYYQNYQYEYDPFRKNLLKNWKIFIDLAREERSLDSYLPRMEEFFTERFKRYWLYDELMQILLAEPVEKGEDSTDE